MAESELSKFLDAGYVLMEDFKKIAPGTQKHCVNVAEFCESVAKEVGLKSIEALKCAALFHDIGKIYNPTYFIENQAGINPHDKIIDPYMSYQIISRHVSDSVFILHQHKFPTDIINIIAEHHGDSSVKYFHAIALKNNSGIHPNEIAKMYRYHGNKPQTTESSILMVCDRVEATARSKFSNGKLEKNAISEIEGVVTSAIHELVDDDQLDNMKIGVMKKMKQVLIKELSSMYHTRISYPEDATEDDKTIADIKKDRIE